jgi:hypothetical protein
LGSARRSGGSYSTHQLNANIGSLHSCSTVEKISERYSLGYFELCL